MLYAYIQYTHTDVCKRIKDALVEINKSKICRT